MSKKPTTKTTNAGRPREGEELLEPHTIRVSPSQWEKLGRLGGAVWVRTKIDAAKDPAAK